MADDDAPGWARTNLFEPMGAVADGLLSLGYHASVARPDVVVFRLGWIRGMVRLRGQRRDEYALELFDLASPSAPVARAHVAEVAARCNERLPAARIHTLRDRAMVRLVCWYASVDALVAALDPLLCQCRAAVAAFNEAARELARERRGDAVN